MDILSGWVRKVSIQKVGDFLRELDITLKGATPVEANRPSRWPVPTGVRQGEALASTLCALVDPADATDAAGSITILASTRRECRRCS